MILLLTGCINPAGMAYTSLSNPEARKEQYINAIRFYLTETRYPIVFSENSGTDISPLFKDEIELGRMECLPFFGNQDKERGKGFGECEIIQYALDHSRIIRSAKDQCIAKITGRLIVRNITRIIQWHTFLFSRQTVFFSINSDLTFPDSRFMIAPITFYRIFLESKETINDSKGYYFENALCDAIKKEKHYPYMPFLYMPCIEGTSGSTGKVYSNETKSISFVFKYAKYALSQKKRFNRQFR